MHSHPETPAGFCQCGCGERTSLCIRTRLDFGHVAGEYHKFVAGHRPNNPPYLVNTETGCWIWQRKKTKAGYGQKWHKGRTDLAHRVYWEEKNGTIPHGMVIDHMCNTPSCVNPDHLRVTTTVSNVRRSRVATLNMEQAREIRASTLTQREMAEKFSVHQTTISNVVTRKRWREV